MDVPGYIRLYTIEGGLERFSTALSEHIQARIELNSPVTRIEKEPGRPLPRVDAPGWKADGAGVRFHHRGTAPQLALVHRMERRAVGSGHARPLRFLRPSGPLPARQSPVPPTFLARVHQRRLFPARRFRGCCVYDESARQESGGYGVLGWLLAGNDAVTLSNLCEGRTDRSDAGHFAPAVWRMGASFS